MDLVLDVDLESEIPGLASDLASAPVPFFVFAGTFAKPLRTDRVGFLSSSFAFLALLVAAVVEETAAVPPAVAIDQVSIFSEIRHS